MPTTPVLHTERLQLRPVDLDRDAAAFHRIYSHAQAMRFMPTPLHGSVDQTRASLQWDVSQKGAHLWAIEDKVSGELIGQVNFLGATRFPGMGYIIHPDYWGQGYTVEAGRAVLDFGFETLGYDRVELWIHENNAASQRVADKLGFRVRSRFAQKYPHGAKPHRMLVFGLLVSEWHGIEVSTTAVTLLAAEPVLMVHDVARTAAFYRDKLGFHIDFLYGYPPQHGAVSRGEWSASLVTIQFTRAAQEHEIQPSGYVYIFMGAGLDTLYAEAAAQGVEIVDAPENHPWGRREFTIRDCNGHTLVFSEPS